MQLEDDCFINVACRQSSAASACRSTHTHTVNGGVTLLKTCLNLPLIFAFRLTTFFLLPFFNK